MRTRPAGPLSRPLRHRGGMAVLAAATLAALTACSYQPTPLPSSTSSASSAPTPSAAVTEPASCDNATQSYDPLSPLPAATDLPADSTMAAIRQRGRLIAGVSADTYLLGSRNPLTGQVEGFDIDLVKQIARAILGDADAYQLRVITAAERIEVLQAGEVDIVARNMTMTCDRWEQVAFSAEYYSSGQKILVRTGSPIADLADLAGTRVCAPAGTSSMDNLVRLAPEAIPVPKDNHTGCLVAFQRGEVDAITGDDTVLAGLAAQDPYAQVLAQDPFTAEPYGIAIASDHVDLVRFVNGVLAQLDDDGGWDAIYDRWLAPSLGASPGMPEPVYGRAAP